MAPSTLLAGNVLASRSPVADIRSITTATQNLNVIRFAQVSEAGEALYADYSDAPRWRWPDLYDLTGPMLPGDLIVVGAYTGNGKTALMLSQLDHLATAGYAVLYAPLELDPRQMRAQWAAWQLGYAWDAIARGAWNELPVGARDRMIERFKDQLAEEIHFAPDRRLTLDGLRGWIEDVQSHLTAGKRMIGAVIVDHFHRMNHGADGNSYRLSISDGARALKDLAREYSVPVICTAQLNRSGAQAVFDRYFPAHLDRLKETSALSEEADVVLMLSRRLRENLGSDDVKAVQSGHKTIRDFEEPGVMQVTIRKHRLDDRSRDRTALLQVVDGRVVDRYLTPR
jgi:hypothetical protein